jgi:hypothetical protein
MPTRRVRRPSRLGRSAFTSWSRRPEERAIKFDGGTRKWIHWLRVCSLPLPHIAELLAIDLGALDAWANRATRKGRRPRVPTGPPRRSSKPAAIRGQNGRHVRVLQSLGYAAPTIARVLDVALPAVEDFLIRITPIRRAALVRPRDHTEQARIRPPRRRPDPPPPRRPLDWRELDDVGPDGRLTVLEPPPAAELDDQVAAELPAAAPPPPREWIGSTTLRPGGKPRLSEEQAAEVRRERAAGSSEYELARKHKVARNTIHAILIGKTYPPPCPAPVLVAPKMCKNPGKTGNN